MDASCTAQGPHVGLCEAQEIEVARRVVELTPRAATSLFADAWKSASRLRHSRGRRNLHNP